MIRKMRQQEIMLMPEFLYEAIYQKQGAPLSPRTVLQDPAIWKYIDGFGTKKDDLCMVAEEDGIVVGAVWTRCIQSYGYVGDGVPELAISLYSQYRGKGIGQELLKEMLVLLKEQGYEKVSLSVQKDNYAAKMYEKIGFVTVQETDEEQTMIYRL